MESTDVPPNGNMSLLFFSYAVLFSLQILNFFILD